MNTAFLLTGGNEGNRMETLEKACGIIAATCGPVIRRSALYETAAWGKENQPAFLNQALLLRTHLSAYQLIEELLLIEKQMGRERKEKYGPRLIDIDILFFNNEVIDSSRLTVPHPEIQRRRFALVPLHEIAADYIHPVLHKTINELLARCTDPLTVKKYS